VLPIITRGFISEETGEENGGGGSWLTLVDTKMVIENGMCVCNG